MRALRFVFLMLMSLIHIVPFAVIGALIAENFITHPKINLAFDGYPHVGTIVLAILASIAACGVIVPQSDRKGRGFVHIYWITAQIAAAWPMARLALAQPTTAGSLPFFALALALFLTGAVSLLLVATSERPNLAFPTIAIALMLLVFTLFLRGERSLEFSRDDGQVNATYRVTRWCGFTQPIDEKLLGVKKYESTHQSELFDDIRGDGVVLSAADDHHVLILESRIYWNGLARQVQMELDEFLDSQTATLRLAERTPVVPLIVIVGFAAGIIYAGTASTTSYSSDYKRRPSLRRAAGWVTAAVALFSFLVVAQFIYRQVSEKRTAFRSLADTVNVEVCDFQIRGKTVNTDSWRVTVDDPHFGDADLRRIVPYLMEAPALWLDLSHTQVTDAGVHELRPIMFIPILKLQNTQITAACLDDIHELAVRHLDVRGTAIRGADLNQDLLYMVESLWISDLKMSVKELPAVFRLRDLEYVSIDSELLTQQDLDFWREELDGIAVEINHVDAEVTQDDFDL